MTVCVASISREVASGDVYVATASDRMISDEMSQSGFEPAMPKIYMISNAIGVMWAGDAAFARSIIVPVFGQVAKEIDAREPNDWVPVKDVAYQLQGSYNRERLGKAVQAILAPRGYKLAEFREVQSSLPDGLGGALDHELAGFVVPSVEFLVVGIDADGAHIYIVDNGDVRCSDTEGFAAIGSGKSRAVAHFMRSSYSPACTRAEAVLHSYFAKRDAEATWNVGSGATDVCLLGPRAGMAAMARKEELLTLGEIHRRVRQQEIDALSAAKDAVTEMMESPVATPDQVAAPAKLQFKATGKATVK